MVGLYCSVGMMLRRGPKENKKGVAAVAVRKDAAVSIELFGDNP